ncbi:GlxA family transcriptional regulator [Mycobacteroides abscessus]|uniref:GlxA family transcriptional regulator n=1 Tax=Mycobacteroides abscessus TaxID=36809 RepID=UPI0003705A20|nr:helix-turn-helix domain-containing protein [Mycobacteroides abscessus]
MLQIDLLVVAGSSPVGVATTLDMVEGLAASHLSPSEAQVDLRVVGGEEGHVVLRGGLVTPAVPLIEAGAPAPWVVVPGIGAAKPAELEDRLGDDDVQAAASWLGRARTSRVAASCTGTFMAAEAELLSGRFVTTTWWLSGLFARRYPTCHLDADRMLVRDGPVVTAGAALGHVDLLLAIVSDVFGPAAAQAASARSAASPRSSQAPFRSSAFYREVDPELAAIERYAIENMSRRVGLGELADAAKLSPRTLTRRVQAATGLSPLQFVQRIKVEAALYLLADPQRSVSEVARNVGLSDASTLNRLIRRTTGNSPSTFRRA